MNNYILIGFLKRAAEYGVSQEEALNFLEKSAYMGRMPYLRNQRPVPQPIPQPIQSKPVIGNNSLSWTPPTPDLSSIDWMRPTPTQGATAGSFAGNIAGHPNPSKPMQGVAGNIGGHSTYSMQPTQGVTHPTYSTPSKPMQGVAGNIGGHPTYSMQPTQGVTHPTYSTPSKPMQGATAGSFAGNIAGHLTPSPLMQGAVRGGAQGIRATGLQSNAGSLAGNIVGRAAQPTPTQGAAGNIGGHPTYSMQQPRQPMTQPMRAPSLNTMNSQTPYTFARQGTKNRF